MEEKKRHSMDFYQVRVQMPEREMMIIVYKLIGSSVGSILAVIFMVPKTRTEAIRRLIFSVACGMLFSPIIRLWVDMDYSWETVTSLSGVTALVSWWLMGILTKFDVEALLKLIKK